ncbi:uncharacterized protein [Apostichopus japonicus]|uniref:uncharacterized protein isoform X2 n=1 Tax=Stichopus japonicus TaxID=307972 RepID=UPI003AB63BD4
MEKIDMSLDDIIKQQRKERAKKNQQKKKTSKGISPLNRPAVKPSSIVNGRKAYSARYIKLQGNLIAANTFKVKGRPANNRRKQGNINSTGRNRAQNQRKQGNVNIIRNRRQANVNAVKTKARVANNQRRQGNTNVVRRQRQNIRTNNTNQARQSYANSVRNNNRQIQINRNRGQNTQRQTKTAVKQNGPVHVKRNAFMKKQAPFNQGITAAENGKRRQRVKKNVTERTVVF